MQGGTIPARKVKGEKELKSLYTLFLHQKITIAKDNMIVKIEVDQNSDKKETIVVPTSIIKRPDYCITSSLLAPTSLYQGTDDFV